MATPLTIAVSCFLLAVAAASDAAARRISNELTVALAAAGFGLQLVAGGAAGAGAALGAALLVGAALFLPWSRGWLGGGDLKLAVAAALAVGWDKLPAYALGAGLALGPIALLAYAASSGAVRVEIRGNLQAAAAARLPSVPARASGGRVSVPAGAAIAAGAIFALVVGRLP